MGSSSNLSMSMSMVVMTTVVVVLGMASLLGEAAETPPADCAQDLVPCADYLNNTAPPAAACCTAITEAVATKLPCLCNLFLTPGIIESLGGNVTSALRIAKACGQSLDVAKCKAAIAPSPESTTPSTPGVPGAADKSGSGRIEWIGFSALLLFWASVMFC